MASPPCKRHSPAAPAAGEREKLPQFLVCCMPGTPQYGPSTPCGGGLAGGSCQAPRWRRIFSTTRGSSMTARTRIGFWQTEQRNGSTCQTAAERRRRQEQWAARQAQALPADCTEDEFWAARVLFYSLLNEQQRRLYAGLESAQVGHGGDHLVAQALGLTEQTVARGRHIFPIGARTFLSAAHASAHTVADRNVRAPGRAPPHIATAARASLLPLS